MKLVFLSDDFPPRSFGGAGISTFELALGMKNAGHDVSVITTSRKESEAGESEYMGLKIFTIATDYPERWRAYVSLNNHSAIREVAKILEKIQPDAVHANNIHQYLSYASLKVAKKYAKTVVWTARDTMAFSYGKLATEKYLEKLDARISWFDNFKSAKKRWNPFRNILIKKYLQYADHRVAISHSLQEALSRNGIDDVKVIYNGISPEEWHNIEGVREFKAKHALEGKKVILFGGRLSPAKGGDKAIEALTSVAKEASNAVMLCVGGVDVFAQEMKEKARSLGVEKNLIQIGWLGREEVKKAYGSADVVLMPSLYLDPFGRVNIEAMSAGKPVIGTRYGGTPEIVEDGVTGYIVDPRDAEEMGRKIADLLKNSEKAEKFGEAGKIRVTNLFSLSDKIAKYLELYDYHS